MVFHYFVVFLGPFKNLISNYFVVRQREILPGHGAAGGVRGVGVPREGPRAAGRGGAQLQPRAGALVPAARGAHARSHTRGEYLLGMPRRVGAGLYAAGLQASAPRQQST